MEATGPRSTPALRVHADGVLSRAKNLRPVLNQIEESLGIGNQLNALDPMAKPEPERTPNLGTILGEAADELDAIERRLGVIMDHLG